MAFPQPTHNLNTDFCLQILKHVCLKEIEKGGLNSVFSPISVHVILSMIAAGAKGRTLEQMLSFLKAESIDQLNSLSSRLVHLMSANGAENGGPSLSFVNGLWVDRSLPMKPTFRDVMNTVYKAEARAVDFQSQGDEVSKEVNSWVEKATHGLITELLPCGSINDSTVLVLANALYFKGAWKKTFDASDTHQREFYLLNGNSIQVPFMTSKKKQVIRSFEGFKVHRLPYQTGQDERWFSMYFFLPDKTDGLQNLVHNLGCDPEFPDRYTQQLWEVEVGEFRIPRFNISFSFKMSKIVKEIGLVLPFSDQAELDEMVEYKHGHESIRVSEMLHKSFVEVNEEGTEAAASTVGFLVRQCLIEDPLQMDFVADHPFLFMIRELGGAVLFIGTVLNPSLIA